ncbi:MAG TPA: N-acetylmuramoyl-L-alanine amidase [Thermoanaerobaculia bacterium]|nr:N-acetylmuramoyl-L-alanine amidase [Thermoanaerobaculia bacterium]
MKRLIAIVFLAILAVTSMVLAQSPNQATLRTASGDRVVAVVHQGGQTFFAAEEVLAAFGATVAPDANGFRITLGNNVAAFGPDSRYGVVRDDLIEMPVAPITVEGKPYVPWQFFQGFLKAAAGLDVTWDAATRVLAIRSTQQSIVSAQLSVANVQGISKIVVTLSAPSDFTIAKEQGAYIIRFKAPIRSPFAEQTYDDPYVARAMFQGNDLRIQLTGPDVVGDAYRLDNPFRVVLDLKKGAAPAPGSLQPIPAPRPVELPGIRTIVIDPGHGGKDVGATGRAGMMEKDATLAVAKKLSAVLAARLGVRVMLTRTDDSQISLDQRTAVANQFKADLFLSVHMNAAGAKGAHGSETYFLSLDASDELARKAAETENASARQAGEQASSSDLKLILWDLAQQEYLNESSRFAQAVQEEMNRATGVLSRGVKQAPFKVLVGATMPAALVEVAFITNPEEESKLQDEKFQNTVVESLTNAITRYKTDYEMRIGVIQPAQPAAAASAARTGGGGLGGPKATAPSASPATMPSHPAPPRLAPLTPAASTKSSGT